MSDLSDLLKTADVRTALIVDDAFDQVPTADDLAIDADEWGHFFDDLHDTDNKAIMQIFSKFNDMRAEELQKSNEFIAALWMNKGEVATKAAASLFQRYEQDMQTDLRYLAKLREQIESFGLTCEEAGRDFQDKAQTVDLIVIDLFLGSGQEHQDIERSIRSLQQVIVSRSGHPPLVILMSRSTRLTEKRADYRDGAGLFESAFRIISKADLERNGKLARILARLGSHYADSLKLAAFLDAWSSGMESARQRTSTAIRRLDLPEIAQVRQLLLDEEEAPTGAYLVDVFDRVLLHELEAEAAIIDTAIALQDLTTSRYPPPYVAGSRNLQNLVYCALFQHPQRLRLLGSDSKVSFGDIMRRKPTPVAEGTGDAGEEMQTSAQSLLSDIGVDEVLVVMSPACDLQRQGAKRVLLLVGDVRPLLPSEWTYKEDPARTSVYKVDAEQAFWIKWDVKHIETLSHSELDILLVPDGEFEVTGRLRESHAIELQQKLLANMGRIGLPAAIPATFEVELSVYVPNLEKKLTQVDIPVLGRLPGVCYVGRPGDQDKRLILCEEACEAICDVMQSLDLNQIYENTRETIEYLRATEDLLRALESGIALPSSSSTAWKDIPSPSGATKTVGNKQQPRILGLVRNATGLDIQQPLGNGEACKGGIVLVVRI